MTTNPTPARLVRVRITEYVKETFEVEVNLEEGQELTEELIEQLRVEDDSALRNIEVTEWHWEQTLCAASLTDDAFMEQYRPHMNSDETLREYRLSELEGVDPNCVWTMLDCEGDQIIVNGNHRVNRLYYIVTEVPALRGDGIEVMWLEDDASAHLPELTKP